MKLIATRGDTVEKGLMNTWIVVLFLAMCVGLSMESTRAQPQPDSAGDEKQPKKQTPNEPAGKKVKNKNERDAPGWDAIDAAFAKVYGDQKPIHVAPQLPPGLEGGASLYGVSIYLSEKPARHWHYVTYGMTELFKKESDDPATSGWGFEFTVRVAAVGDEPPSWPTNLLMKLADYVFRSGRPFASGHRVNPGSAIAPSSSLNAIAFTKDPGLGGIATPFGSAHFLQLVGITTDELARMKESSTDIVLKELSKNNNLLITDPKRKH